MTVESISELNQADNGRKRKTMAMMNDRDWNQAIDEMFADFNKTCQSEMIPLSSDPRAMFALAISWMEKRFGCIALEGRKNSRCFLCSMANSHKSPMARLPQLEHREVDGPYYRLLLKHRSEQENSARLQGGAEAPAAARRSSVSAKGSKAPKASHTKSGRTSARQVQGEANIPESDLRTFRRECETHELLRAARKGSPRVR